MPSQMLNSWFCAQLLMLD